MKPPLPLYFFLALVPTLFGSLLPLFPLNPSAPLLTLLFYRTSFSRTLWTAFFSGLLLDLLSFDFHFGLHALTLTTTTLFLYHQKKHFFEDKPIAVFLLTSLVSSFSTLLHFLFIHIFDRGIGLSLITVLTDFFLLPLADGLFGFLWFTCPATLYIHIKKRGWRHLFKHDQPV